MPPKGVASKWRSTITIFNREMFRLVAREDRRSDRVLRDSVDKLKDLGMTVETSHVRRASGRLTASLLLGLVVLFAFAAQSYAQVSNCPFAVSATTNHLGNALMLARYARTVSGGPLLASTGIPAGDLATVNSTVQSNLTRLDVDGDGVVGVYDSVVAARVLFGVGTSSAVAGIAPSTSGSRTSAAAVKAFLDAGCPASSGPPAITAVSVAGGIMTVTGTSFGTRARAAPLRFEDFESRSVGALPQDFGYTGWSTESVKVDDRASFSGSRSLRHLGAHGPASTGGVVAESFPHVAVTQFQSDELYLSYRLKFRTNGSQFTQLKFNRSGMDNDDGNGCYHGKPRFFSSYYPEGDRYSPDKRLTGVQGGAVSGTDQWDEGWAGEPHMGSGSVLPIHEDTWVQVEEYYRLNDVGAANGVHMTWVNGNPQIIRSTLQPRTAAAQKFNCSYLVIGMDYWINEGSTNGVTVWYDDHYLDTSRARLVLANASTWAASTQRSPQPATQWSSGSVTAPLRRAGFAAGDAWLYVVRQDGAISASWRITLP